MEPLPGMTECEKGPADSCRAIRIDWKPLIERKIILIATATIQTENVFSNGLFQNIFFLYKLFDAIGYVPILIINNKPKTIDSIPTIMRHVRMLTIEELSKTPMPIHIYLEIGMSIDASLRKHLNMTGARIAKLYLGNILNIDIETPMFYPAIHFSHHIVGELNEIWVSPHYKQHDEYAAIINHVNPGPKSLRIAPYVWDPCILTLDGSRNLKWRPRNKNETETIVILEPNISFQKTSLIPLLIAERNYRENKRHLQVIVGNSERLLQNPFFMKTIMPTLELAKDNKIHFDGRFSITEIMTQYPHCTAICHQLNNQYNYMTLEYITAGFPLVHNAPDWYDVGYYYKGNDPVAGATALLSAQVQHENSQEKYKSGAEAIRWRHSPYNPEMQKAWKEILG
jgi:hypothetical protein